MVLQLETDDRETNTDTMPQEVRINQLHYELQKAIKKSFMSHSMTATLYSENATKCAYKGLHYTITSIINELQKEKCDVSLISYNDTGELLIFHIKRSANFVAYDIYLTIYKIEENNQIIFEFMITR